MVTAASNGPGEDQFHMTAKYRIFGMELSPYSVKVRSYFRYKGIPHEWIVRDMANMAEFQKYAKLPLIPLVVTPEGEGIQDSTPIIEKFEKLYPEPSIHPPARELEFLSALIEEYADEWGNKPMFHFRWTYEPDQQSAAERIASATMPGAPAQAVSQTAQMVRQRMVPRLKFVGSREETRDQIEQSFRQVCAILENHLSGRKYLFGNRPALADFGLYAQLYECSIDPTPGAYMKSNTPRTLEWISRMLDPKNEGGWESWEQLESTLTPLLSKEVGEIFLPWSHANTLAIAAGKGEMLVNLLGKPFSQEPQKYHAKSLSVIRQKYAAVANKQKLDPVLEKSGCLQWLRPHLPTEVV